MQKINDGMHDKNSFSGLLILAPTCKELRSCCSYSFNKNKIKRLKMNNFSWMYQRIMIAGQTNTLKSGKTDESRDTTKICLFEKENPEAIIW